MATQIVILNKSRILIDDSFGINWADKGKNWVDAWCPDTIHAVIWNDLIGQNEIQSKDASTGMMTGNTNLSSTSDAVGSTTIAALLTWAETRKGQIETAVTAYNNAAEADQINGTSDALANWQAYDSNHS
tara:strand:- start:1520 stop:1909 length:390 start_codon:yes stop_codon:yes gene_type:complete